MSADLVVGCVGKPSAGKSTFFNAATDAQAKVGNYPFTTIEPNFGVTWYQTDCACKKFDKTDSCNPRYGRCDGGTRWVPVKLMDVAGLVPGASEGHGLGNKFLDDLRQADVLLHIIDVSGTTNEKGEETTGYDPINDVEWLHGEIHSWIFNNVWGKWSSTVRRHTATKSTLLNTLQLQLSGYGANSDTVCETLARLKLQPGEMGVFEDWGMDDVKKLVDAFLDVRFPTLLVLNKIDLPNADKNIARICEKYGEDRVALTSALAECFLRKMKKSGFIQYKEGDDDFATSEEDDTGKLKAMDDKVKGRLEKIRDLVLYRYGDTGIYSTITTAVNVRQPVPVFPVRNIHNFTSDDSGTTFRDCLLVKPGTTVREVARIVSHEIERAYGGAVGADGRNLGEDDPVSESNNVFKFIISTEETPA